MTTLAMSAVSATPAHWPLHRQPTWEADLAAWAATQVGRALVWGETDCASLAIGAVAAMTRADVDTVRGAGTGEAGVPPYATKFGAWRAVRRCADAGGVAAYLAALGCSPLASAWLAGPGDLVVAWHPRLLPEVGVCLGRLVLCANEVTHVVELDPFDVALARLSGAPAPWTSPSSAPTAALEPAHVAAYRLSR